MTTASDLTRRIISKVFAVLLLMLTLLNSHTSYAAPGDILFQDTFNGNLNSWTINSSGGNASIGNETSNQGRSLRLRWNTVTITSNAFNAAVPGADITVWIRRGSDTFSEDPDTGEDLLFQYLNNTGTWVTLETFDGGGLDGEIYNRTYSLPAIALHANLQLRFTLVTGSGNDFDYWHIDDLTVTETFPTVSNCENFESGFTWTAAGAGSAGVNAMTFNSPGNSMYLRWNTVTATSPISDFQSASQLDVTAWIRRGSDAFSEDPDNGEDLVVEYLNNIGNWITLETFSGNGSAGQILTPNYSLNADALHANFQLRFRLLTGNGSDFDYWHIDDVCYVTPAPSTDHFDINHDTAAVNCQAEPVTIDAHLTDHSIDTGYTGTLSLTTSTAHGDWTIINGLGTLINGAADDGAATYTMVAGDNGSVTLGLKNTHVETLNINVNDGVISELSGTAIASEDQNLAFAASGFSFLANGVANTIGLQIGGKASDIAPGAQTLELQAIRTSPITGACEAALQGIHQIQLAYECRNPTSCSANQVNINGGTSTNIAGNSLGVISNYTPVNLDFGNASDTTASFVLNYPDVGEIQLYARYNIPLDDGSNTPSGIYMLGNSNAFVSRPFGFYVAATGNPGATGPAGAVFTQAGSNFNITATAMLYQSADDLDNNGIADGHDDTDPSNNANLANNAPALNYGRETAIENISLSALLNQPVAGNDPGLAGTTSVSSFVNGSGNTNAAHYDEVGIVEISGNVADGDYLGIGVAATNNLVGKTGYVGRFIPNHFVIANPVMNNRSDILACADPFTYMDENFRVDYDLQAFNARLPAVITQNYVGSFAKLDVTVLAQMNYGATDTSNDLTARLNVASAGVFVNGTAPVQATTSLSRLLAVDGPYSNAQIGIAPLDSDNVALQTLDLSLDGGPNTHGEIGQTDVRYGRLNIANNFGSELLPLNLQLVTQYYANATSQFVTNTDDNCTVINTADVLLYNDQEPKQGRAVGNPVINISGGNTTTLTAITPFVSGIATMNFTAPNAEGYVDMEVQTPSYLLSNLDGIDQGIQGPGQHCTPGLAAANPAFIPACAADAIIVDDVPLGRGTFGIFRGSDRVIYIREVY